MVRHEFLTYICFLWVNCHNAVVSEVKQLIQFITILFIELPMLLIFIIWLSVVEFVLPSNWFLKTLGKPRLSYFVTMLNSPQWKQVSHSSNTVLEKAVLAISWSLHAASQTNFCLGVQRKIVCYFALKKYLFNIMKGFYFQLCHRFKIKRIMSYLICICICMLSQCGCDNVYRFFVHLIWWLSASSGDIFYCR